MATSTKKRKPIDKHINNSLPKLRKVKRGNLLYLISDLFILDGIQLLCILLHCAANDFTTQDFYQPLCDTGPRQLDL